MAQISLESLLYSFRDQYGNEEQIHFLGHCLAHTHHTNSQNFQDVWALYETKYKMNGFFVEFGATNGVDGSNTLLLEANHNWTGILAEPNVVWHDDLIKNRKAKIVKDCVYTETGKTLQFVNAPDPTLSTIQGFGEDDEHSHIRKNGNTFEVNTISLADMLKSAPYEIDYMSVDTEGSEYDILNAYFSNHGNEHMIRCITIEHNYNESMRQKLFDLMSKHKYERKFTQLSRWDDFYLYRG